MHDMALPSLWHARARPGNALDNAGLPRCTHPDNNSASRLLLSGLETGHPAAAGPSPACDFSVSDEQKAVFLVSVLDCSECDSSGLYHLNSSWSIARLGEYFRRKIGHS